MHILFVALLIYASYTDIKKREIPITVPIYISIISLFSFHPLGIISALPVLLVAYFIPNRLGGGDIKLVASVGLYLGLMNTLYALIIGLSISVIYMLIVNGREDKGAPLVPFMSIGFLIIILGGL